MKLRLFITISISVLALQASAQKAFKPSIVVLRPVSMQYDSVFSKEIREEEFSENVSAAERKEFLKSIQGKEENIRQMQIAEFEYSQKGDFASLFSFGLCGMITYRVFGETDNGLILPSHDTSSNNLQSLKKIANKHKVNWVVSPVILSCYIKDGKKFSKSRILLYDLSKNKIIIDKEYIGESENPGFELSCENGSLECTINNLIGYITHEVVIAILGGYQH